MIRDDNTTKEVIVEVFGETNMGFQPSSIQSTMSCLVGPD